MSGRTGRPYVVVFAVFFFGGLLLIFIVAWLGMTAAMVVHAMTRPNENVLVALFGSLFFAPFVLIADPPRFIVLPQLVAALAAVAVFAIFRRLPLIAVILLIPIIAGVLEWSGFATPLGYDSESDPLPMTTTLLLQNFLLSAALEIPVLLACWWLVRHVSASPAPLPVGSRSS